MRLPYELDAEVGYRATLGLIVLQADETIEADFRTLVPDRNIRVLLSRVECIPEVTPESLPGMTRTLPQAASLLPAEAGFGSVGYACTSGATVLGEDAVAALVASALPGVTVTNPLSAVKAACRALGVDRIALVSPYVEPVSQALRTSLAAGGIEVAAFGSFEQKEEKVVARIAPQSVLDALIGVGAVRDCQAVFASCTNLRATPVLAEAERQLGKPVLASNQVLAWHMLRLAGVDAPLGVDGALSALPLKD